jgi:hypothetical protein
MRVKASQTTETEMRTIEEARDQLVKTISTDPKVQAREILGSMALMAKMFHGMPGPIQLDLQTMLLEETLIAFKAKVQDELLADQQKSNDALAAALQMTGRK